MVKRDVIIKLLTSDLLKSQDITKEEYEVFKDNKDLDYIVVKIVKERVMFKKVMKKELTDEKLNLAYMFYLDKNIEDINKQVGCIYGFVFLLVILIGIGLILVFMGFL